MGYQGTMHRSRSNYKGGYRRGGSATPYFEPDNRFYRRHGGYSELDLRRDTRKAAIDRKRAENPRLVRFNFLHHNL